MARAEGFKLVTGSVTFSRFTGGSVSRARQARISIALEFDAAGLPFSAKLRPLSGNLIGSNLNGQSMTLKRATSLFLLLFMGSFGVLETAVSALAPRLGGEAPVVDNCPPEMTLCPMHAGEPCCCGHEGPAEASTAPGSELGQGCLDAPEAPPVTFPVSPLFRFVLPESADLDRPLDVIAARLPAGSPDQSVFYAPPTPPPQSL